ncbi:hypothetical protein [Bradyrhizobium sp.]
MPTIRLIKHEAVPKIRAAVSGRNRSPVKMALELVKAFARAARDTAS